MQSSLKQVWGGFVVGLGPASGGVALVQGRSWVGLRLIWGKFEVGSAGAWVGLWINLFDNSCGQPRVGLGTYRNHM